MRVVVGGGYYVRALARDLGGMMGCGAHLAGLHRSAIGPGEDPGEGTVVEVRGRGILPWLPRRVLSDAEVGELRQGRMISVGEIAQADWELPQGFPAAAPMVRGFHLGRFRFLLTGDGDRLKTVISLGSGI